MSGEGPLFLACSPRVGGNSDMAISLVRETLGGPPPLFLRNHEVLPCLSCGHCAAHKAECFLVGRDDSAVLFDMLQSASSLVLAAPIYFYHLPAQLKAFMDRSQPWWMLRDRWCERPFTRKNAYVILVAARPQGERLFEGAVLSLTYWLDIFGFDLVGTLTMYGLEGPGDLRENAEQRLSVIRFAEDIKSRSGVASFPSGA